MTDHARKSNKNNEPSIAGLLIVAVASVAVIYWTLPNYFLHLDYRTSKATIVAIDSTSLSYEYENTFDEQMYTFQRDLASSDYQKIKSSNTLIALYPNHFPEHTILDQIDKKRPLIVTITIHLLIILTIYKPAKGLTKAPREESSIQS